jgi:SMC interacting uncharacterized protein involved in chromosome segregation
LKAIGAARAPICRVDILIKNFSGLQSEKSELYKRKNKLELQTESPRKKVKKREEMVEKRIEEAKRGEASLARAPA